MLGIYIFAAIIGGGLLVFSVLAGADHDAGDGSDFDSGHDFDHDVDHDGSHDAHDLHAAGGGWAGDLLLGLFRPRNFIFFLAGFGVTGTLLTLIKSPSTFGALIPSLAMGAAAMLATHGTFVWLRRSESAMDAVSDTDMEGCLGRVVIPLSVGERGRIACRVGEREVHVVAALAEGYTQQLPPGAEVVVLRVADTVAYVMPFDKRALPPSKG
jgi:hypothetical protein